MTTIRKKRTVAKSATIKPKLIVQTDEKCSCYGGFDCQVCNPEKYDYHRKNGTPWSASVTDTPRTDALMLRNSELAMEHARQLERELIEAKAEIEMLKNIVKSQHDECLTFIP